jgi:hypothetical protein
LYAAFKNEKEFVAKEIVQQLYELNRKFQLNFFQCEIRFSNEKKLYNTKKSNSESSEFGSENIPDGNDIQANPQNYEIPIISERFDEIFIK